MTICPSATNASWIRAAASFMVLQFVPEEILHYRFPSRYGTILMYALEGQYILYNASFHVNGRLAVTNSSDENLCF